MSSNTIPPSHLSDFARKFGARKNHPFRSYLTPTELLFPNQHRPTSIKEILAAERYQRRILSGFTTRELAELDALTIRDGIPGNLTNPILPMLDRDRWERDTSAPDFTRNHMYPYLEGTGEWSAHNDQIWKFMLPVVRLASRILMSGSVLPWFEAFLNVEQRCLVPLSRVRPKNMAAYADNPFETFHIPNPRAPTHEVESKRDEMFRELSETFQFTWGFKIEAEDPRGPEMEDKSNPHGNLALAETMTNWDYMIYHEDVEGLGKTWKIFAFINSNKIKILRKNVLNHTERLLLEWNWASTMAHETMHAIAYAQAIKSKDRMKVPFPIEPFFEGEAIPEVGWSFESAVLGGTEESMIDHRNDDPTLGSWLKPSWPCFTDITSLAGMRKNKLNKVSGEGKEEEEAETSENQTSKMSIDSDDSQYDQYDFAYLINPPPKGYEDRYPIPMSVYENAQQTNFWELGIRNYGHVLLFASSLKVGVRTHYQVFQRRDGDYEWKKIKNYPRLSSNDHPRLQETENFKNYVLGLGQELQKLTPAGRKVLDFGLLFIQSTIHETEFWAAQNLQQNNTQNILDIYESIHPRDPDFLINVTSLLGNISIAIGNHDNAVTALIILEETKNTPQTLRRKTLLEWNRGTRKFCKLITKQMQPIFAQNNLGAFSLDTEFFQLENCRLRLFHPSNADIKGDKDEIEQAVLADMYTTLASGIIFDETAMQIILDKMRASDETSVWGTACLGFVYAGMQRGQVEGWEERLKTAKMGLGVLDRVVGDIKVWRDERALWADLVREVERLGRLRG